MSYKNVVLKILLILSMGKSADALAKQTGSGGEVRYPNCNSFEQSGNLTAANKKGIGVAAEDKKADNDANHKEEEMEGQEGMLQLVDQGDTVVGFPNCLGKGQSLWNLTRERQLRGGEGSHEGGAG